MLSLQESQDENVESIELVTEGPSAPRLNVKQQEQSESGASVAETGTVSIAYCREESSYSCAHQEGESCLCDVESGDRGACLRGSTSPYTHWTNSSQENQSVSHTAVAGTASEDDNEEEESLERIMITALQSKDTKR